MKKIDVMAEAYNLIKGEVEVTYMDCGFIEGVVKMAEAVMEMCENEDSCD